MVLIALTSFAAAPSVKGQGGAAEKIKPTVQPKKPATSSKSAATNNVKRSTSVKSEPSSREVAAKPGMPTLTETLDWLRNNVSPSYLQTESETSTDGKDKEYQVEVNWKPVRFNGCTLEWNESSEDRLGTVPTNTVDTTTVQLNDLDPTRIKIINFKIKESTYYGVGLETFNGKPTIKFHVEMREINGNKIPGISDNKIARTGLIFRDEETAQRGLKALENAVKLCGGKASSF